MDPKVVQLAIPLAVILLAAVSITTIIIRGHLKPEVFDDAPPRDLGFMPMDVAVAMCIMLVGMLVLVSVLNALGIPVGVDDAGEPVQQTDMQMAWTAMLSQLLTQLPIVLFVLVKARAATGGLRKLGVLPRRFGEEIQLACVTLVPAFSITFMVNMACMFLTEIAGGDMPESGHKMLQQLIQSPDALAIVMMSLSAVVVAPILEEFVYRGLVQTTLLNIVGPQHRWRVIIVSAIIFGGVHASVSPWQAVAGLMVLGVILGWLYEKTGSLWPSILVHMLFNITNIALATLGAE